MPRYWVKLTTSPPLRRREEVRGIVKRWGGRLVEEELYLDVTPGSGYVLVEPPAEDDRLRAMLAELRAVRAVRLETADEAQRGFDLLPPDSAA